MNTPATAHLHVCVWIDHGEAKILGIGLDNAGENLVRQPGPYHHIHRKADHIGEGKAPPEETFSAPWRRRSPRRRRCCWPELARRSWGVEPMNHPTDPEIIQAARKFFRAAARLHE